MIARSRELVAAFACEDQVAAIDCREAKHAVCVGGRWLGLHAVAALPPPGAQVGAGNRLTGDGIEHKALHAALATAVAHHDCQVADPEIAEVNSVVDLAKVPVMAGDQEIEPLGQILWHIKLGDLLLIVIGRLQFHRPLLDDLLFQKCQLLRAGQ